MHKKITLVTGLLVLFAATRLAAEEVRVDVLLYQVSDPAGEQQSLSRIMVTDEMLRMDEIGEDALPGYVLFDRRERRILSVDPESSSIMLIGPPADEDERGRQAPDLDLSVDAKPLEDAPAFAGKQPFEYSVKIAGENCFTLVAVQGMSENAMQALGEMHGVLAERHRKVADAGQSGDCKLLIDAYRPGLEYSKGLLLSFVGSQEVRQLVEFKQSVAVDSETLEAPLDFRRFQMP